MGWFNHQLDEIFVLTKNWAEPSRCLDDHFFRRFYVEVVDAGTWRTFHFSLACVSPAGAVSWDWLGLLADL